MMGEFRCDDASEATHAPMLWFADPAVKPIGVYCPRLTSDLTPSPPVQLGTVKSDCLSPTASSNDLME